MSTVAIRTTRNTSQRFNKTDVLYCLKHLTSLVDKIYATRPMSRFREGKDKDQVVDESRRILKALIRSARRVDGLYEKDIQWKLPQKKISQLGYGRYVGAPGAVDCLVRELRHIVCHKYCTDIDIVNCHPVLLHQMAERMGVAMPNLAKYVLERETIFEQYATNAFSREDIKAIVISTLYGGKLEDPSIPALFFGIEREVKKFMELITAEHQEMWACINREKKTNKWGSFLSNLLQREERRCLDAMVDHAEKEGWVVDTLCADGFLLRNKEGDMDALLRGCEGAVNHHVGYSINLIVKPMTSMVSNSDIQVEKEEGLLDESVLVDDKFAWEKFVEYMGDNLLKQDNVLFVYNDDNGMWESGRECVIQAVCKMSDRLIFKQMVKAEVKVYNYGGCTKNINNMLHHMGPLSYMVKDTRAIQPAASRGCILFMDGWYDMKTKVFHEGFDDCREKYFTKRIKRTFEAVRNPDMEALVLKTLFRNPYNSTAIGDFYMNGISRAVAGIISDKVWWSIVGRPDCGKGVMTLLMKNVFDEYVGEFNMNVLKYNVRDGSDEAKRLAWYAPLIGCRIAIGNEVRIDGKGLDGNLMKTLSSGGDTIQLRQNFQNQYTITPTTTFFGFCNDLPPITPCDEALKNRMSTIPHTKTFVQKPQEECSEYQMQGDPLLKDKIATPEWINAYFWLIMDAYNGGVRMEKPDEVKAEVDELFQVEDDKIKELLEAKYEFVSTTDEETYVAFSDISKYLACEGIKMSDTAIGRQLRMLGLKKANIKKGRKTTTVYYGLQE